MSVTPATPPIDDALIDEALDREESYYFDCKRLKEKLAKVLETVVAFANSDGGTIALGLEDPDKGVGRDRVYGIQENPMNWDELRQLLKSRITEADRLQISPNEIGCRLRDGSLGSVVFLRVYKSTRVHSIVDDGTFIRLDKSNRQLTAPEINELSFQRGTITAETQLEEIDFDLLDTIHWREYKEHRKLSRPIAEAMYHVGLAGRNLNGVLRPKRAAVLLFAEDPSGVLASKSAVRIFHFRGDRVQTDPNTNLLKTPITVGGPLQRQIREARNAVIRELASGIQVGPMGFDIVQKYPVRVLTEAVTNAVIHRDYRLSADVHIRIFSDRIEIDSPGLLAGPVTAANIGRVGRLQSQSADRSALARVSERAEPRRWRGSSHDDGNHVRRWTLSADLPDAAAHRAGNCHRLSV
jgi:ATP-dependent DNA helicase RecG